MENKHTFHVDGLHCKSCVLMTESELLDVPGISRASTSLEKNTIEVTGDFGDKAPEIIAEELSTKLKKHGYTLSTEKIAPKINLDEFKIALPLALLFIALFIALQKFDIVNIVDTSSVNYKTAFAIGVIASLSTCMAVVGGLVLSMSATFAKEGDKIKPQIYFHLSRLIAFFLLGGVIGMIGSAFALSSTATIILGILIGIVMLILGVNLLGIFDFAKNLQPAMPKFLAKNALNVTKLNHRLTPVLLGVATFFLPCGFTQSMQIYTLSTNSFVTGGLTMLAFALGTLPALLLVSFSSLSVHKSSKSGIFFKTAGLIVIAFALFNLINSLVIIGIIPPVFTF
jgi:sulfite exporter TauE/SafE/copper chaperone CopZ